MIEVRTLFNECANVHHVKNPVYVEVADRMYVVTGVREQQGMFVIETVSHMNGSVPNKEAGLRFD